MDFYLRIRINVGHICLGGVKEQPVCHWVWCLTTICHVLIDQHAGAQITLLLNICTFSLSIYYRHRIRSTWLIDKNVFQVLKLTLKSDWSITMMFQD